MGQVFVFVVKISFKVKFLIYQLALVIHRVLFKSSRFTVFLINGYILRVNKYIGNSRLGHLSLHLEALELSIPSCPSQ